MLRQLYIENIAVIECADIVFMDGFNVLSGETGAGKSIIIDSLNAILGGRVSRELIRTGQSKASVCAVFTGLSGGARKRAEEMGIEIQNGELMIRRDMYQDGKNICKINGMPATIAMLKSLSDQLVNIHGQHDGQHLLNEALHIDYLDEFGHLQPAIDDYERHYEQLLSLNRKIKALSLSESEKARRAAVLSEQKAELESAGIKPGEQEELLSLRSRLIKEEKTAAGMTSALSMIDGGEENAGAAALLGDAAKVLGACEKYGGEMEKLASKAREVSALCSDLSMALSGALMASEFSPKLLEDTEERLDKIERICRKYSTPADQLAPLLESVSQELSSLQESEEDIESLKLQYAEKRQLVFGKSQKLHEMRLKAAEQIAQKIEGELSQLDMPGARFSAEVESLGSRTQARFTKKGTDSVRFMLSTNSGEDLKPLSKVASGGELSRIMLALKNVLSGREENITAVFDEIDTGVSGRAASRVGEKLYSIAKGRQVLCVTHLPQIACLADHQYNIVKHSEGGRTFTKVTLLDGEGRIAELSRLTAGVHITKATYDSARELLQKAEEYKAALGRKANV